jgi:tetratricopeptide (TPR) repeat protein
VTEPTSKRLAFLQKLVSEGSQDPMAYYGLALEYGTLGRHEEALSTFKALRGKNPAYVPMYLMCGQLLEKMSLKDEARDWYSAGVERAREAKNDHARSELESALGALG